jgi:hypothetical protein
MEKRVYSSSSKGAEDHEAGESDELKLHVKN